MYTFNAKISKGSLSLNNRQLFNDTIACLKDGDYVLEVKERKKKRSNNQNAYYFGVVVTMICKRFIDLGNDVNLEHTHDFLKATFNYKEIVKEETGEIFKVPIKTSELSTAEFNEYIERVIRFGAEVLDIYIPLPNEQTELFG